MIARHPVDLARAARFAAQAAAHFHQLLASARRNGNLLRSLARGAHEYAWCLAVTEPASRALRTGVSVAGQAWAALFVRVAANE